MPSGLSPARRFARVSAAFALASAGALASASAADAACAQQTTTKAFAAYGDNADYVLAPGGSFESTSAKWSLTGSTLVSGSAPFAAAAKTDRTSLSIPGAGLAASPAFCVGQEHPTFRFLARKTSGTWAQLLVKIRWTDSTGRSNDTVVGSLDGSRYASWAPSPPIVLAQTLPIWNRSQSFNAKIVLDPEDAGGTWQVDNVYIDPFRRQ